MLVGAILGAALHAELIAVVQARDALHQDQRHHRVKVMRRVLEVGRDPRNVVVAEEVDEGQPAE